MGSLARPLKIRGHHLLCMLGFRGLGYSPEFAVAMGKVVESFRSDATLPIIVVNEGDIICDSCPHYKDNKCRKKPDSFRKVKTKDTRVLKRLGLKPGSETSAGEAWARVKAQISSGELAELCAKCEWLGLGYCAEGLEKLASS